MSNQVVINEGDQNQLLITTNTSNITGNVLTNEVVVNQPLSNTIEVVTRGPQGAQGTLLPSNTGSFSISGSLNITGNILLGSISDPALFAAQTVTANTGITTIYALPISSYEGAFFDYTIRSGSNSRAGQIMGLWSGSAVNFTEVTTVNFGNTAGFNFGMSISSSNMILSSSATTSGWTVRTIIRSM
jgi:hypothetical protein